jgi:mRNA turnover protein 4
LDVKKSIDNKPDFIDIEATKIPPRPLLLRHSTTTLRFTSQTQPKMPKSKRAKVFHLTQVTKKTREQKEKLFDNIRECIPQYQHCFVFSVDNMRNNYLKDVRRELDDCRYVLASTIISSPSVLTIDNSIFFGKTKLTARALGSTPEEAQAPGIDNLTRYLSGTVGLLFTNREPASVTEYITSLSPMDFARAGAVASRTVVVPPGVVYSTAGQVAPENDVPLGQAIEPELRKLGMPTRMVRGRVVLGDEGQIEGYTICKEGETLDSRQTRLLKLFSVCISEFRIKVRAYWSAASGEVTEVEAPEEGKGEAMEEDEKDESE